MLATLPTLYALTLGSARAELMNRSSIAFMDTVYPVMVVWASPSSWPAVLALVLCMALRFMSRRARAPPCCCWPWWPQPPPWRTWGSAPLAYLLGGMLLKTAQPRAPGLAAPAGQRLVTADHADVRAEFPPSPPRPTGAAPWPVWCWPRSWCAWSARRWAWPWAMQAAGRVGQALWVTVR